MKLSSFLLMLFTLAMSAGSYSQENKVSLEIRKGTMAEIFSKIEAESGYSILYRDDQLDRNREVSVTAKDMQVNELLAELLSETSLDYKMVENIIVIVPREVVQQVQVTGIVTDMQGIPLPGASISEKGTTNGTITNVDGSFSISVASESSVLVISFMGYLSQEIQIGSRRNIEVSLAEDIESLDEVVVVGYGYMKKSDITGSIASVGEDNFKAQPVMNASEILKGRTAGVAISQNSGRPGGDYKIRIRGANSILGGNSPLIVLDGIQMSIGIEDINPRDIASMEVLKDASATAIYGSRGANGVILITTKSGVSDTKPTVEIQSSVSVRKGRNPYDLMGREDYAKLTNLISNNEFYTQDQINARLNDGEEDMYNAMLQTGIGQIHMASVRGGTSNLTYFISGGADREKGVLKGTEFNKYTFRSNFKGQVSEELSLGINLTATSRNSHNLSSTYPNIFVANLWGPMEPIFNEDGTYNINDPLGTLYSNPYMLLIERNNDSKNDIGMASGNLSWEIVDGLTFRADVGASVSNSFSGFVNNEYMATNTNVTGSGRYTGRSNYWQTSTTLTYVKTLAEVHDLSIMGGFEQSRNEFEWSDASGTNLATTSVGYNNLSLNEIQTINSGYSGSTLRSYMGRLNYGLKDRYLLTATLRSDGSSKFRGDNQFSLFPSAAIGWRLSEEDFIKNLNLFSNLKVRGSWGITGNQGIPPYGTLALLSQSNYSFGLPSVYPGYKPEGVNNPDLRWEETTQTNFGLDMSFFESRLSITVDYFNKETSGLLQAVDLPKYSGGGSVFQNIGEITNKGFEFTLNTVPVNSDDFMWTLNFNLATLKNNVESLGDQEIIFPGGTYGLDERLFAVIPGHPLGTFYGYKHLGIWRTSEAAEAASFGASPGDNKFEDYDGDGEISSGDHQPIGNALPTLRVGMNTTLDWKNFSLNLLFDGAFGADIYNMVRSAGAVTSSNGMTITLEEGLDYWTESNDDAKYANPLSPTYNSFARTSQWLMSGDYVKLKNISLSYRLPRQTLGFGELTIFVSGQDLLVFTNYIGDDPEFTATGGSDVDNGIDFGSYPMVKSVTGGLTLIF